MADQIKQIKEFPQKPDFGDDDLLLIQGQGTTYNVQGRAVKKYAEDSAKPQVELAAQEAQAAAEAADRAEAAIQHPAIPDPATGNWKVWDQVSESYQETVPPVRAEGQDFEIKGYYPTLEALEAAVPSPEKGYAYGIGTEAPYDIYVWDVVHGVWVNNGPMTASGDMLKSKYDPQHKEQDIFAYADAAHVGKSMAGQTVEPEQGTTVTAGVGAEVFNTYSPRTYGTDEGYETVIPLTGNVASGAWAHAEGTATTATGHRAHAEGQSTIASGEASHAEGGRFTGQVGCIASSYGSHAEGTSTTASGNSAHAEGRGTKAQGMGSHSEGQNTTASKDWSHAEGQNTVADGVRSHAEGYSGIAEGSASHVEGGLVAGENPNKASGYAAHAEGASTLASGNESHAEGDKTTASGLAAHAEGGRGIASGNASHVEGGYITGKEYNKASAYAAHAEGESTEASGEASHAEGRETIASGNFSHAEGNAAQASGRQSHAEGYKTEAIGYQSHAGGAFTIAKANAQTVIGWANVVSESVSDVFIVGYGSVSNDVISARANAFRVTPTGVFAKGNYNASGADYAELFEWTDGNPESVDRVGRFVTLEGKNIRLAGPGDGYILGIVSGAPSVVGDVYDDQWQGMYLTDIFGRPIWEDVEVPDLTETVEIPVEVPGEGDEAPRLETRMETRVVIPAHTERRQKLNPDYDPNQPYVPRSERPEWDAVGMLGKLVAVDDGTCQANGWATVGDGGAATASEERTRFRVMERLDESHVRILILVS